MTGRRRHPRYRLSKPLPGAFVCFQELDIERREQQEVSAVSDRPVRRGEYMQLDLIGVEGRSTVNVQVADSVPTIVDGNVRYRLRLGIVS